MVEEARPTSSLDAHAETMHVAQQPLLDETAVNIPREDLANDPKSKSYKIVDQFYNVTKLTELEFYQSLLCEFLGTMLLTIVATSTGLPIANNPVPTLNGALASGLIVATIIVGFGYISGAHINPAVTVTFLVTGEIDFLRGLCYIGMQLLGAISASSLVYAITPAPVRGSLGMTMITNDVTTTQAFVVEFIITFVLCYTVHAICDQRRNDVGGSKALAVGFAVTVGCLFGGPYTGGSMNPARSFGPAWALGIWKNHWIYWFGPLTGSITAALVYTRILKKPKSKSIVVVRSQSRSSLNQSKKI